VNYWDISTILGVPSKATFCSTDIQLSMCYKIASNNLITTLSWRWRACRINVDIMTINRVKALK